MRKYLGYILIPFLAVFLMSHNVSAFTITESVTLKGSFSAPYWSYRSNSTWSSFSNESVSRSYTDATITGVRFRDSSNTNVSVKAGDYVVAHSWFVFNEVAENNIAFINVVGYLGLSSASEARNCSIQKIEHQQQEYWQSGAPKERYTADITCVVLEDNTLPTLNFYTRSNVAGLSSSGTALSFNFTGWDLYEPAGDIAQQEQESANNIENQSPSDVGSSDNAGTTNLINALGGFITTIANAPATNCVINGDLGHVDIGGVNLCQGKEHFNTLVEFIGFTALFGVVFWAGYHLVKRTLSLIDWARSK